MGPRSSFLRGGRRGAPRASSSSTITACSATPTHSRPLRPLTHRREEGPMRPLTVGTSLVAGIFALGCTDEPLTAPAAGRPRFEISDAAHTSGTPGFYFLPPMVAAPTFTGTFVSGLTLEVEICVWTGTACDAPIATFTTKTGSGSETVRVDPENEQYVVNNRRARDSVNTAEFVPVVNGQTLPIAFRIEDGAILALALGAMRTWYNTSQGGASVTND